MKELRKKFMLYEKVIDVITNGSESYERNFNNKL